MSRAGIPIGLNSVNTGGSLIMRSFCGLGIYFFLSILL
jgi:hypothetical protein